MFEVYRNKKALITGITGFKGSWLAMWLNHIGALVSGFGLEPDTKPNLFQESGLNKNIHFSIIDIRDPDKLIQKVNDYKPEIIFHLASQPLVTVSYENPSDTIATNVMGLVNLCEVIKNSDFVRNVIIVTSDKCYLNEKGKFRFKEEDALGGLDPYSASKSCAEIIAKSYANSFFIKKGISSASVRAGNIIGGGDWSKDRLVPDIVRASFEDIPLIIRNPNHVRPWQHVLEALAGYLKTGEKLILNESADFTSWNFGPDSKRDFKVSDILDLFVINFNKKLDVEISQSEMIHEAEYLQLDSQKAKQLLKWENKWDTKKVLEKTSEWYKEFYTGTQNAHELCLKQIIEYENSLENLTINNI